MAENINQQDESDSGSDNEFITLDEKEIEFLAKHNYKLTNPLNNTIEKFSYEFLKDVLLKQNIIWPNFKENIEETQNEYISDGEGESLSTATPGIYCSYEQKTKDILEEREDEKGAKKWMLFKNPICEDNDLAFWLDEGVPADDESLKKAQEIEFNSNPLYKESWQEAKKIYEKRRPKEDPERYILTENIPEEYHIALILYTLSDKFGTDNQELFKDFNNMSRINQMGPIEGYKYWSYLKLLVLAFFKLSKIAKYKVAAPCILYRGITGKRIKGGKSGGFFSFQQFLSGSTKQKKAAEFSFSGSNLEIHIDDFQNQINAIKLSDHSVVTDEEEIIIWPFETYQIINIDSEVSKMLIRTAGLSPRLYDFPIPLHYYCINSFWLYSAKYLVPQPKGYLLQETLPIGNIIFNENRIYVTGDNLLDVFGSGNTKSLQEIFQMGRKRGNCFIIFDKMESIDMDRDEILCNELFNQIETIDSDGQLKVLIISSIFTPLMDSLSFELLNLHVLSHEITERVHLLKSKCLEYGYELKPGVRVELLARLCKNLTEKEIKLFCQKSVEQIRCRNDLASDQEIERDFVKTLNFSISLKLNRRFYPFSGL